MCVFCPLTYGETSCDIIIFIAGIEGDVFRRVHQERGVLEKNNSLVINKYPVHVRYHWTGL